MNTFVRAALAFSTLVLAPSTQAATILIDVNDAHGYSAVDYSDENTTIETKLDPYSRIKGISYSVTLTSPTGLGGALIWFGSTSDAFVQFRPDRSNEEIGTAIYSGRIDLRAIDSDFWLEDDGILRLQFADNWADYYNTDRTTYHSDWKGWFNVDYESPSAVPEPATWLTMVLGFALAGAAMRRYRPASGNRLRLC
ncbi:PEPxxWA-CTERM sorting domain-containing protein [Sphingomonas sp. 8AM]|uniref:PEPxxWA-CTERM sorting domain-containing protein n=1 Tax=Sphingomonas sp. 8AM TaxID=2653170 RepID=UPI0012F24952|nr:PEPxxWA-CTERM sorting domain-containing protein [Sphingomonas sp. 8AM]VXC83963.1 conserved exported hypothetical protein [Sphingomonas sp. 8AM]